MSRLGWRGLRVIAVSAVIGLSGCGPLESNELKDSVGTIHSAAEEGAILARDAARGRTTVNFVRVHAGELSSAAQHEAEKLTDAKAARGVAEHVRKAIAIASDESSALDDLRTSPRDRAVVAMVRMQLLQAAKQSDDLDAEL